MPKACARLATSLPMRPGRRSQRLPEKLDPEKVFRSHWPARMEAAAWDRAGAAEQVREGESAVAIVLPDGGS